MFDVLKILDKNFSLEIKKRLEEGTENLYISAKDTGDFCGLWFVVSYEKDCTRSKRRNDTKHVPRFYTRGALVLNDVTYFRFSDYSALICPYMVLTQPYMV